MPSSTNPFTVGCGTLTATHPLRAAAAPATVLFAVTAAFGAVHEPASVLLSALVLSLLLLLVPALAPPASTGHPGTRRRLGRQLAATAAVPPFAVGAHAAGVPAQVLTAAIATAGAALVVQWFLTGEGSGGPPRHPGPRDPGRPAPHPEARGDRAGLAELFRTLPLEALCAEWRALRGARAHAAGTERGEVEDAVRLLREELHRRDPHAARRWAAEDPAAPPERYFRDQPRDPAP